MQPPISIVLEPFIPDRHRSGVTIAVRQVDDDDFEIATIIPGNGAKQGGIVSAEQLYALAEKLKAAAVFAMNHRWQAVPVFADRNGHMKEARS